MRPTRSGKVTLIELGFLILNTSLISLAVRWVYYRFGWRGVAGFFVVYGVLPFVGLGLVYFIALTYTGSPYYPTCGTGKCHRSDYQRTRLDNGQRAVFCQCGTRSPIPGLESIQRMVSRFLARSRSGSCVSAADGKTDLTAPRCLGPRILWVGHLPYRCFSPVCFAVPLSRPDLVLISVDQSI